MSASRVVLDFSKAEPASQPVTLDFSKAQRLQEPSALDRANELAGKALTASGLPTSISDIPNWFQHFVGVAKDSRPVWDSFKKAVEEPTQENIVGAVPFIGPASVAMSKDVQKGDYAGAAATLAGTVAPTVAGAKAPQIAEGLTDAGQAIHNAPTSVKNALGEALRDEYDKLKPGVKATTAIGKLVGVPEVAEALIPSRADAASRAARRAVPITKSPNFDAAAYKAGAAERTTQPTPTPSEPSPFGNATPTGMTTLSAMANPPLPSPAPSSTTATRAIPQGNATPFVSKFTPPEPSRIQSPDSGAPAINKTLASYDRGLLVEMAKRGDLNALRELIRNPGGFDVATAVPNSRYLMENPPRGK